MGYKIIISSFLLSIGLISISAFYALNANRQVLTILQEREQHFKAITTASAEVSSYSKRAEGHLFLYLALHRHADGEKFPKRIKSLQEQIEILDKNIKNTDARNILDEIKENTDGIFSIGNSLIISHDKAMGSIGVFELEKYRELIFGLHDRFSKIRKLGVSLVKLEVQLENKLKIQVRNNSKRMRFYLLMLIVVSSLFSLIFGGVLIGMVRSLKKEVARRLQSEQEVIHERNKLKDALEKVKTLSGLLPICASCKKIRDDKGYWSQIESYIRQHSEVKFSHGLCPECAKRLYPKFVD